MGDAFGSSTRNDPLGGYDSSPEGRAAAAQRQAREAAYAGMPAGYAPAHASGDQIGMQTPYGFNVTSGTESAFDPRTAALGTSNFDRMRGLAPGAQFLDPTMYQMLAAAAAGKVPSAAALQQQQGLDAILRSQMAARASQRGSGAVGASNRLAGESASAAQLGIAGQAAELRAQEQAAARGQLLGAATTNLQSQQMYDELMLKYTAMGYSMDEADRAAKMQMAGLQAQLAEAAAGRGTMSPDSVAQLGAAGASAAGTIIAAAASDRAAKKRIKHADEKVEKLLDAIHPYEYEYKDPKTPTTAPGKHLGIMAQDLELSDAGKTMVIDTGKKGGKMVDLKRAIMAALAGAANLNRRLRAVEGK